MHKHLYKITSYTESTLISYKPITPVNQLAAQGPVISYTQLPTRFEDPKILTLENIVLWNTALYKCIEVSKEFYASIFSLTSMMTAFSCSYIEIFQGIFEFFFRFLLLLITQNIWTFYRKSRKYKRLDGKVKGTDYLEGLGIDGRWDSGRDPPRTHYIYHNVLFLPSALFPLM